jgi:formate hydrogenlyase transcriptional activator
LSFLESGYLTAQGQHLSRQNDEPAAHPPLLISHRLLDRACAWLAQRGRAYQPRHRRIILDRRNRLLACVKARLLESELFGHEKGAFTGAIMQRVGRFELANRGTIFLDEVGEIPLELQPKLLRVLQEREFERLGSTRTIRTDARLIAAANRDLKTMVEEQRFRSDLYYRLNVFPIRVPSLRERKEDIPLLVRHFVKEFSRRNQRVIDTIPSETMQALIRYHWPGNIRELQNVIERAVIISRGSALKVALAELEFSSSSEGHQHQIRLP